MLGVDLETGRARYDIEKIDFTDLEDRRRYLPDAENTTVAWCPGIWARNWQKDAYSPRTGLLYTSASNRCGAMRVVEGSSCQSSHASLLSSPDENRLATAVGASERHPAAEWNASTASRAPHPGQRDGPHARSNRRPEHDRSRHLGAAPARRMAGGARGVALRALRRRGRRR